MQYIKKKKLNFVINSEYLIQTQSDFLVSLFMYCEKLEKIIEDLSTYKTINKKLIKDLNFFQDYYYFLKNNESAIKIEELDFSDESERKLESVYEKENFFQKFKYAFNKSKLDIIILKNESQLKILKKVIPKEYKKLYTVNLSIGEIYEESMKAKMLILYLKNHKCTGDMVENILFDIHFGMYKHVIPSHFENIDKSSWGILYQIDWLEKNLDLFKN